METSFHGQATRNPVLEAASSALSGQITLYVLLAGVVGGLLLVLIVLCCCKLCIKPSKLLTRQPVFFTKYSSDRQSNSSKYRSLDPSITIDLETSCGYSENSASPRDHEDRAGDVETGRTQASLGGSPRLPGESLPGIPESKSRDKQDPEIAFIGPRTLEEVHVAPCCQSPPLHHQSPLCLSDSVPRCSSSMSADSILVVEMEEDEAEFSGLHVLPPEISSESPSPDTRPRCTQVSAEVHHTQQGPIQPEEALLTEFAAAIPPLAEEEEVSPPSDIGEDEAAPPPPPPSTLEQRRRSLVRTPRCISPLEMVPEDEGWEEERDGEGKLHRTASTESGGLETMMEERRRLLRRQDQLSDDDDDEPRAKVRYNDTGSLEEVDEDAIDMFVDDDIMDTELLLMSDETQGTPFKEQYRKLWQLRATFEEDEGQLSDDGFLVTSSPEHSPEQLASQTTSFESNTEPVVGEAGEPLESDLIADGEIIPSYERRRSYKSILTRRLQRLRPGAPTPPQSSSADNSFDSVDTEEGSSTDASRLEMATTSFESTTDNTDSPGGEGQTHRLQQMKADSGYKSLETNGAAKHPMLTKKQIHFALEDDSVDSVMESRDEEVSIDDSLSVDEGYSGGTSDHPPTRPRETTRRASTGSLDFPGKTSKKRREFFRELRLAEEVEGMTEVSSSSTVTTTAQPVISTLEEVVDEPSSKSSVFARFFKSSRESGRTVTATATSRSIYMQRDYSIDEKSDALFREFSRLDPAYEVDPLLTKRSRSPRLHGRHRLHHSRHMESEAQSTSPRTGRRKGPSPQGSIEEAQGEAVPLQDIGRSDSRGSVPIIQVAEEDTV